MELKLENGRYSADAVGIAEVGGAEELAQRITMKLTARRGKFWPMPAYGSRLYTLISGVRPADRQEAIRAFVAEALADEPGVSLENTEMSVKGDTLYLELYFRYTGGGFTVSTAIREEI